MNAYRFPVNTVESPRMRLVGANLHPFSPATYIWEVTPAAGAGYRTTFFWGNDDGTSFQANERYIGCHPYPYEVGVGPTSSAGLITHWEISANGHDTPIDYAGLDDNGNSTLVQYGRKYLQGATVEVVGSDYVMKFYYDLPDTTRVITYTFVTSNYIDCPSPAFIIGGNAWASTSENLCGDFQRIKILTSVLSAANISLESADLSRIVTSEAALSLWFGKSNWLNLSDLTCNYGTGRSLEWVDVGNRATLVAA